MDAPKLDKIKHKEGQFIRWERFIPNYSSSSEDEIEGENRKTGDIIPKWYVIDFSENPEENEGNFIIEIFHTIYIDLYSLQNLKSTSFNTPEKKTKRQEYYNKKFEEQSRKILGSISKNSLSPKIFSSSNGSLLNAPKCQRIEVRNESGTKHRNVSCDEALLNNGSKVVNIDNIDLDQIDNESDISNIRLNDISNEGGSLNIIRNLRVSYASLRNSVENTPNTLDFENKFSRLQF